jgi:hypothetical protein
MRVLSHNEVFPGNSGTSAVHRSLDWTETPPGAADSWPQSLRTAISICLNSSFPIVLWWGPELTMLYNDAYMPIIANKHPGHSERGDAISSQKSGTRSDRFCRTCWIAGKLYVERICCWFWNGTAIPRSVISPFLIVRLWVKVEVWRASLPRCMRPQSA